MRLRTAESSFYDDIGVEYELRTTKELELYDGSRLLLKKLARDCDPTDRFSAIELLAPAQQPG